MGIASAFSCELPPSLWQATADRPADKSLARTHIDISGRRVEAAAELDQVAHWLFAFGAAGMSTFRALTLIATLPAAQSCAHEEILKPDPPVAATCRLCVLHYGVGAALADDADHLPRDGAGSTLGRWRSAEENARSDLRALLPQTRKPGLCAIALPRSYGSGVVRVTGGH